MRLVRGLGTPCDPLHTGIVEVFHDGLWGTICVAVGAQRVPTDLNVADTVCRQLGFPYGTIVSNIDPADERDYVYPYRGALDDLVESEEYGTAWVDYAVCSGDEANLLQCTVEFVPDGRRECMDCVSYGCGTEDQYAVDVNAELEIACRQFPVEEATEAIVTPGAGALPLISVHVFLPPSRPCHSGVAKQRNSMQKQCRWRAPGTGDADASGVARLFGPAPS